MIKRTLSFLFGFTLVVLVIYLGFIARNNQTFVLWFGLAAALFPNLAVIAFTYTFTAGNRRALERLSKVPDIEKLIDEAKSQEEKIKLLEQERSRLLEVVEFEARKETLFSRKNSLEEDAARILTELDAIDNELSGLETDMPSGPVSSEIGRLRARIRARQQGDLVFKLGSRSFILSRSIIINMPFGGIVFEYYKLLSIMNKKLDEFIRTAFYK